MSLDITILDANDRPTKAVAFSPGEHWQIFGQLTASDYPLLSRLSDYYQDAEWKFGELPLLRTELLRLKTFAEMQHLDRIDSVLMLVQKALENCFDLNALAD